MRRTCTPRSIWEYSSGYRFSPFQGFIAGESGIMSYIGRRLVGGARLSRFGILTAAMLAAGLLQVGGGLVSAAAKPAAPGSGEAMALAAARETGQPTEIREP